MIKYYNIAYRLPYDNVNHKFKEDLSGDIQQNLNMIAMENNRTKLYT